jgi:hypothetical protein
MRDETHDADELDVAALDADETSGESEEPTGPEASSAARRKAHLILEVLAGVRTPTSAAEELAIPLPRYYQWEDRAVAGLVAALEPRRRGPQRAAGSARATRRCSGARSGRSGCRAVRSRIARWTGESGSVLRCGH